MLALYIIKLSSLVWVSSIFLVIEVETIMLQIAMLIKLLTMWLLHPNNDAMPVELKILVFSKFSILLLVFYSVWCFAHIHFKYIIIKHLELMLGTSKTPF